MSYNNLVKYQKQNAFIEALTLMGSIEWACKKVDISRSTYYRWLKDEEFQEKVAGIKHLFNEQSVDNMVKILSYTLGGLESLVRSDDEAIRLKSCLGVVKNINNVMGTAKARDMLDGWIDAYVEDKFDKEEIERNRHMPKQLNFLPESPVYYYDDEGNLRAQPQRI